MAANFRTRNQLVLAKVEATTGTEETPTPSANAVRLSAFQFSADLEQIETNYFQGGLSQSPPETGGGAASATAGGLLGGSGTAGSAPDLSPLLRACALSETLTASAVTGTAQAGASATITLAVGASGVNDAYRGMVIRTTGGTGSGQERVVTGYVGSTKVATVFPAWSTTPDATTTYSIDANVLYRPVSQSLETATIWAYLLNTVAASNARRRRIVGAAGSARFTLTPRGFPTMEFTMRGQFAAAPDDVSAPSTPTFASATSTPIIAATSHLGAAGATPAASKFQFSRVELDLGVQVDAFDDPSAAYGYDAAGAVSRTVSGTLAPPRRLTADGETFYSDLVNSTDKVAWFNWGQVAGKKISFLLPNVRFAAPRESDVRGYAALDVPFRAHGTDAEVWICLR